MKLRNKKTGEIGYPYFQNWKEISCVIVDENAIQIAEYKSLAELNEEWEDYEEPKEPKEYWYINATGETTSYYEEDEEPEDTEASKEIGNYFETKEEAEKAVEKLKAWKRLKDKGFRFERWLLGGEYGNTITFSDYIEYNDETRADLDLLFGGEE